MLLAEQGNETDRDRGVRFVVDLTAGAAAQSRAAGADLFAKFCAMARNETLQWRTLIARHCGGARLVSRQITHLNKLAVQYQVDMAQLPLGAVIDFDLPALALT